MEDRQMIDRYNTRESYQWNYENGPTIEPVSDSKPIGKYHFCEIDVGSPLGIAAGPLLHGGWICHYAQRGFDILTYKTVRLGARACYATPNLQPVDSTELDSGEVKAQSEMTGSWAVSFGMPSMQCDQWQQDIRNTRSALSASKLLSVSVVATPEPEWAITQVADDFAQCAALAKNAGADAIELNFSCPNVASCDGQLYRSPHDAGIVAEEVRARIGTTPLLLKIGHISGADDTLQFLESVTPFVDSLVMVNGIAAKVTDKNGQAMFAGAQRGICGAAIRDESLRQTERFATQISNHNLETHLVGVGGIETADHVRAYLSAGAHSVQLATAIMLDPEVGNRIRSKL